MSNDLTVTPQNAMAILEQQNTPEAKAIVDYVKAIKEKNIAVLGTDEAFVLHDSSGQIKAFKKSLTLSQQDGTLIQPAPGGPFVVSAQGYETWAEATGTSVIFPKEVLVGQEWKPNPYAERDPENRRILAVHARAIAFRYSSMGIPQVSDWTTIFDTPSYRMIDLLAKAKKFSQAFKVLPKEMKPEQVDGESWAHYPFDESMNLWINTSHNEVITWLSQILNREKKAMDFAQTFAKRNALKHLSGLQKSPGNQWRITVLAWRPTGNNIVKWDAAQYAGLQDRVAGMVEGGSNEFHGNAEINQGIERTSEDDYSDTIESEVDPEDTQSGEEEYQNPVAGDDKNDSDSNVLPDETQQMIYLSKKFPDEFKKAISEIWISPEIPVENYDKNTAMKVYNKVSELVDAKN